MAVVDPGLELAEHLSQRGAQRVIDGFREDVRTRSDKVGGHQERRARFEPTLDEDASLVDLKSLAQGFEAFFDQRGEGWGRFMVAVSKDEFHDAASFAGASGFDKDTYSHLP